MEMIHSGWNILQFRPKSAVFLIKIGRDCIEFGEQVVNGQIRYSLVHGEVDHVRIGLLFGWLIG